MKVSLTATITVCLAVSVCSVGESGQESELDAIIEAIAARRVHGDVLRFERRTLTSGLRVTDVDSQSDPRDIVTIATMTIDIGSKRFLSDEKTDVYDESTGEWGTLQTVIGFDGEIGNRWIPTWSDPSSSTERRVAISTMSVEQPMLRSRISGPELSWLGILKPEDFFNDESGISSRLKVVASNDDEIVLADRAGMTTLNYHFSRKLDLNLTRIETVQKRGGQSVTSYVRTLNYVAQDGIQIPDAIISESLTTNVTHVTEILRWEWIESLPVEATRTPGDFARPGMLVTDDTRPGDKGPLILDERLSQVPFRGNEDLEPRSGLGIGWWLTIVIAVSIGIWWFAGRVKSR
ncbi:MAG: hypothetical protein RIK87_15560 [Fuerstiella sp.]